MGDISERGLALIKDYESYSEKAYLCPEGVPTIGWGSIRWSASRPVKLGETCTVDQAEMLIRKEWLNWPNSAFVEFWGNNNVNEIPTIWRAYPGPGGQTENLGYDNLSRLTGVTPTTGPTTPQSFTFDANGEGVLDLIFRLKRDQMRRTGQHDIFASPWTTPFLRRLSTLATDDFGLRFATLRAGSRIVAAEGGLRSGGAYHLWFPVYDPEFARYSPGALMTLETLRAAPDQGIVTVDFGPAGEDYKRDFAEPGLAVREGDVTVGGLGEAVRAAADVVLAGAPGLRRTVSAAGRRLDRRWDRITACEPRMEGRAIAASQTLGSLGRRHPKTSIGLGVGLGLGLGLMGLAAD